MNYEIIDGKEAFIYSNQGQNITLSFQDVEKIYMDMKRKRGMEV